MSCVLHKFFLLSFLPFLFSPSLDPSFFILFFSSANSTYTTGLLMRQKCKGGITTKARTSPTTLSLPLSTSVRGPTSTRSVFSFLEGERKKEGGRESEREMWKEKA